MVNIIIIIHGAYGSPEENWFPWLKKELEKLGHSVFIPRFSTPKGQLLENWITEFKKYEKYINEKTIFIGHSIGAAFLLTILENLNTPINGTFLVSGFTGKLNNPSFDKINKTFAEKSFDWNKIRHNCDNYFVFHSDNDPYVPLLKAKALSKNLGTALIIVKGAGHFNKSAGYTEFPLLLDKIKKKLK